MTDLGLACLFIRPASLQLKEEGDYSLYTVVLFKKTADAFKHAARERCAPAAHAQRSQLPARFLRLHALRC